MPTHATVAIVWIAAPDPESASEIAERVREIVLSVPGVREMNIGHPARDRMEDDAYAEGSRSRDECS